jgi:hypothetical protein
MNVAFLKRRMVTPKRASSIPPCLIPRFSLCSLMLVASVRYDSGSNNYFGH